MALDFSSVLKREVMRPLAVTFIPAAVALSPIAYFQLKVHPEMLEEYTNHTTQINVALLVVLFITGMIIENLGSWFETYLYNRVKDSTDSDKAWHTYLTSDKDKFPVAMSYLRGIVDRLKFELSMTIATVAQLIGGFIAAYFTNQVGVNVPAIFWVGGSVLMVWLFWSEAKGSVTVLDGTRRAIFL